MTPEIKRDSLKSIYTLMTDTARVSLGKKPIEAWVRQYGSRPSAATRVFNEVVALKNIVAGKRERPPGLGTLGESVRVKKDQSQREAKKSTLTKKQLKNLIGR